MRHLTAWNVLVVLVLLALITYMLALKANAHQITCGGLFEPTCASVRHVHKRRYRKPRRHKHKHRRRRPEVRAYVRRDKWVERDTDRVICKDSVTVVGDARPSRAAAVSDAESVFMRTVRFKYGGEAWMNIEAAKDYQIRCTRASITELVGQVMTRCELRAKPCKPPFESK